MKIFKLWLVSGNQWRRKGSWKSNNCVFFFYFNVPKMSGKIFAILPLTVRLYFAFLSVWVYFKQFAQLWNPEKLAFCGFWARSEESAWSFTLGTQLLCWKKHRAACGQPPGSTARWLCQRTGRSSHSMTSTNFLAMRLFQIESCWPS